MKIDIWAHILSPAYAGHLEASALGAHGPQSFFLANRALYDLDRRFEVMDRFGDYRQVLLPIPAPLTLVGLEGQAAVDLVRRNNDEMAETVSRHHDRFLGFAAGTPIANPDAAAEEAARAVRDLGALGIQAEADPVGLPLHEARYDPLFDVMEGLDAAVWLHPFRSPGIHGVAKETSLFLLWQVFGWPFDTTTTIFRLIFAGLYDRHPRIKLIAHHGGGLIPLCSGRIEMMPRFTGLDASLGAALTRLHKTPDEYCKMLYVDTAMFGSPHGVECVVRFFGGDHVLFGTDTPFDTQGGAYFIPTTISDVERAVADRRARAAIFEGNARTVLRIGARSPGG